MAPRSPPQKQAQPASILRNSNKNNNKKKDNLPSPSETSATRQQPPTLSVSLSSLHRSPSRDNGDEQSVLSDITGATSVDYGNSNSNNPHQSVVARSLLSGQQPLIGTTPQPTVEEEDEQDDAQLMLDNTATYEGYLTAEESSFSVNSMDNTKQQQQHGSIFNSNTHNSNSNNLNRFLLKTVSSDIMDDIAEEGAETSDPAEFIDWEHDDAKEMTYSRRVALFLSTFSFYYNPPAPLYQTDELESVAGDRCDDLVLCASLKDLTPQALEAYPFSHSRRETPNLKKAWAYFEHVALPRFLTPTADGDKPKKNIIVRAFRKICCKANKQLHRAEPGEREKPTQLYSVLFTPHKQLGDFGLGIGLYFSTLRATCLLTCIAGLVNIPNFMFYSGADYSNGQPGVDMLLKGSAICTETTWVPCPDCDGDQFDPSRIAYSTSWDGGTSSNMTFALQNNCNGATVQTGMVNYATLFLLIVAPTLLHWYLKRMQVAFDEDEQTAQDYSLVIQNPPPDATDPQEWHAYFKDAFGAHVTTCTVAVDNDLLVRYLVQRRELLRQVEMMVEPGTSLDKLTLAGLAAKEERERKMLQHVLAKFVPGLPELFGKIVVLTAKVQGLAQQEYPVTNVFCCFETEESQRRVLAALDYAPIDIWRNRLNAAHNPAHLFRSCRLLHGVEPDEPNTIRWQDLNETLLERVKQQFWTLIATVCAIALVAFITYVCNQKSVLFSSFAIAIFNTLFPMFAKALNNLESHASEGSKQRSLFCKIALFRWVNTAIVITIITPFTKTLIYKGGLINQIYALFFAEIITTNAIQLLDPVGHLKRHFLAPRAKTQDSMNLQFAGTDFELAERYTNMTKIFFLALFYCAIYPGAFFMCAFALFLNYFVDRFSLMRTWKRQPHLGTAISQASHRYFFPVAIVAMAVVSSYFWSAFSFDNLCAMTNSTVSEEYVGTFYIVTLEGESEPPVTVNAADTNFQYCLQDFLRFGRDLPHFPFIPEFQPEGKEWMTDEQEWLTTIYGWTSIGVIFLFLISFCWLLFRATVRLFVKGQYKPTGADQGIHFSDVPSICSYIPQVESPVFSYPLLACNVDRLDKNLLDWTDPARPHKFYDLTQDAEALLRGTDVSSKVVFSQVAHWPPECDDIAVAATSDATT